MVNNHIQCSSSICANENLLCFLYKHTSAFSCSSFCLWFKKGNFKIKIKLYLYVHWTEVKHCSLRSRISLQCFFFLRVFFFLLTFAAIAVSLHQGAPGWVSLTGKGAHVQVADGQPNDWGLIELAGDGPRQRKHLGQLEELEILLPPPRTGRIARLLFTQVLETERWTREGCETRGKHGVEGHRGENWRNSREQEERKEVRENSLNQHCAGWDELVRGIT